MKTHQQTAITLYLFNKDFRLTDNVALLGAIDQALQEDTSLIILSCISPSIFNNGYLKENQIGAARWQFYQQSIIDLKQQLHGLGQILNISALSWSAAIAAISAKFNIKGIHVNGGAGFNELQELNTLSSIHPLFTYDNQTLFALSELPMSLAELPKHFTPFRKRMEVIELSPPADQPQQWPTSVSVDLGQVHLKSAAKEAAFTTAFTGGEVAAAAHLSQYMNSDLPSSYKQVRNELLGWDNSTKFSPWLALGCISPRQIMHRLKQYENENGANESTYWIYFELLWREFFYWNALKQGAQLFHNKGQGNTISPPTEEHGAFRQWCQGCTDAPLINACMRELNHTGFMTNRGRQIAASYLINELGVDWRLGAAYFEQQLIDYDVASNWGNWQYIAGVGADPRGGRHFNIKKQQQSHDPHGRFVKRWAEFEVTPRQVNQAAILI